MKNKRKKPKKKLNQNRNFKKLIGSNSQIKNQQLDYSDNRINKKNENISAHIYFSNYEISFFGFLEERRRIKKKYYQVLLITR